MGDQQYRKSNEVTFSMMDIRRLEIEENGNSYLQKSLENYSENEEG